MPLKPLQDAIADGILANMKEIFGSAFYDLLTKKIVHDFLLDKVDICSAIIEYPSVFERALIGLIGPMGENFFVNVCEKVQAELGLDDSTSYMKGGDLAKFIAVVSRPV